MFREEKELFSFSFDVPHIVDSPIVYDIVAGRPMDGYTVLVKGIIVGAVRLVIKGAIRVIYPIPSLVDTAPTAISGIKIDVGTRC